MCTLPLTPSSVYSPTYDKGLAPALVAAREQLQKSQLQDKLAGNIASRPPREELEQKGILKGASS
ncbi:hypothetical protein B0H14DRAFT_3422404 [Mycena olivaceomarginata]|nr:hypothetical protein B0H14DRAFT_3422404 [Mycena olivaceomarginata]